LVISMVVFFAVRNQAQSNTFTDDITGVTYTVEIYMPAQFPVGMVFAPDGRLFYNEKITGNVRVISAEGEQQIAPVINFPTDALQERGMLGITLDPAYEENGYIWIMHTALGTTRDFPSNRLIRFREDNGVGDDPQIFFDLPIDNGLLLHNGGNVHFDAEGTLYFSMGDYGEAFHGQDLTTPNAAIHRAIVTDDGLEPAPDNPFDNSTIYAYGLRNPFDFTFDPISGNIFATENGPNCDDEVNLILGGFNYGWSEDYACSGTAVIPGLSLYMPPLLSYTPTVSPTGIVVYDHEAIPEWQGDLFFCNWNFGEMWRVELNETRTGIESLHEIDLGTNQCRVDIVVGPEGGLYFGTVGENGGAIMRLIQQ